MCDPVSYAVIRTGMAYQEYQSDKAEAKYIIKIRLQQQEE